MTSTSAWSSWQASISLGLIPLAFAYGFANTTDLLLTAGFATYRNRVLVFQSLRFHKEVLLVSSGVILATAVLYYIFRKLLKPTLTPQTISHNDIKPVFFPCQTVHHRIFPKKHTFLYYYLLAGIPIGWKGSLGGLLSVDDNKNRAWFVVDAEDYLERGDGHLGLEGKLHKYLRSQDVDPRDYPYAYLVTVPKLMGYSFNPVSFWYLYSPNKDLTAMVLEVNNTFDERRPYFLKIDENETPEDLRKSVESKMPEDLVPSIEKKPNKFTNTWSKDFHVSPFNSRKGFYSLIAKDPLYPKMTNPTPIPMIMDNTITLLSSKSSPKLVARVFSTSAPISPEEAGSSFLSRMKFLRKWWWIVYATAIRTIKEAAVLYFSHGLHVWFRPEVLKTSIGRKADDVEKELEVFFRKYLAFLVENSESPLRITYTAAGIPDTSTQTFCSNAAKTGEKYEEITFKVLTPLFYKRYLGYAHNSEAFWSESIESGTIWIDNSKAFMDAISPISKNINKTSILTRFKFKIIQHLRSRPEILTIAEPGKKSSNPIPTTITDIRSLPPSNLDSFICTHLAPAQQSAYANLVLRIFVADWIAFGSLDLLWLEGMVVRVWGAWWVAGRFLG